MQIRIDTKWRGFAVIFKKDALQFVSRWQKPLSVHKNWIDLIEIVAADPVIFRKAFAHNFASAYSWNPDLAAALLHFMRQKWARLENSKAGKLKRFLAQNSAIKWERGFGERPDKFGNNSLWHLQDGELATAFEHSAGGEAVTIDDVVKARKWVARNIDASKIFAESVLDKDGWLHIKDKPQAGVETLG